MELAGARADVEKALAPPSVHDPEEPPPEGQRVLAVPLVRLDPDPQLLVVGVLEAEVVRVGESRRLGHRAVLAEAQRGDRTDML